MMLSALILMTGLISAPSDQSDVLWQPEAATVRRFDPMVR